ncbi:MAG: hypothetical protein EKK46_08530 [Rhodocyclaceae bacterium]|nr:MAG: hypothetical protein EKK46_08530 [Rhodocyclaceae bacterium]
MNIWALPKDRDVRATLLKLEQRLGAGAFVVSQRRCDHPGAVVLCKPDQADVVAYLYTFGQEPGRYGLHLEYPMFPGQPVAPPDIHEGIVLDRVADLLRIHLDVV